MYLRSGFITIIALVFWLRPFESDLRDGDKDAHVENQQRSMVCQQSDFAHSAGLPSWSEY